MSEARRPLAGRAATIIVLAALLVLISAGVYMASGRLWDTSSAPVELQQQDDIAAWQRSQHLTVLLTLLLISALLILLFVLGAYLVIQMGRIVARARSPVGGKPTPYVDAWSNYRLSDEAIAAATSGDSPDADQDDDEDPGGDGPRSEPPPEVS